MSEITVGELINKLKVYDKDDKLMFGSPALTFNRTKHRGTEVQIEFNEAILDDQIINLDKLEDTENINEETSLKEQIKNSKVKLCMKLTIGLYDEEEFFFYHVNDGWVFSGFSENDLRKSKTDAAEFEDLILKHNCYLSYPKKVTHALDALWGQIHEEKISAEEAQKFMDSISKWIMNTHENTHHSLIKLIGLSNSNSNSERFN